MMIAHTRDSTTRSSHPQPPTACRKIKTRHQPKPRERTKKRNNFQRTYSISILRNIPNAPALQTFPNLFEIQNGRSYPIQLRVASNTTAAAPRARNPRNARISTIRIRLWVKSFNRAKLRCTKFSACLFPRSWTSSTSTSTAPTSPSINFLSTNITEPQKTVIR